MSFYLKLSLIFLLLVVMLAVGQGVIGIRTVRMYEDEVEQKLQRHVAARLAERFAPTFDGRADGGALDEQLRAAVMEVVGLNPRLEVYLLGPEGNVKAAYPGPADPSQRVELAPIRAFLDGAPLPLYGTPPSDPTRSVPFSAVRVMADGVECYLYVVLQGAAYQSMSAMVAGSYLVRSGLMAGLLLVGVTLVAGLLVFFYLTRRLRGVQHAVAAFEQGDHATRAPVDSHDEIGALAVGFNHMADTIVAQLDRLRRDDQLRRDLVANVSHDLRSPLASIQGYLETLLLKGDTLAPAERHRYTETLLRNTEKLSRLVEDLFALSHLDARQVEPNVEAFSLAELVQDVVVGLMPLAQRKGVTLAVEPSARLARVQGDLALVERAVTNLVDNAIRYTPEGGHVHVRTEPDGDAVRLCVEDDGVGIPAEDLPRIFDRFYRVEKSRAPEHGGTGLGLAIAQRIVQLHGGTLDVESRPGAGTTFAFTLPLA